MGYYQEKWSERKKLLVSSGIVGGVLALVLFIWVFATSSGLESVWEIFLVPILYVALTAYLTAIIAVFRMIMKNDASDGILINMLNSFWIIIWGAVTGGPVGMFIGFLLLMLFFGLFALVAVWYIVYLPISLIYYFVKAKNERISENE